MTPPPCSRCSSAPSSVYFPAGGRCAPCFHHYITRTFKVSLGRLGVKGHSNNVVVAVSGGPTSCALALLLADHLRSLKRKPEEQVPVIKLLHVLKEGGDVHESVEKMKKVIGEGAEIVVEKICEEFVDGVERVKDVNDRGFMWRAEVDRGIIRGVKRVGGGVVLMGSCVERSVVDVIMAVGMGRGGAVKESEGMVRESVRTVKPLRDVEMRYLLRYVRWRMPEVRFESKGLRGIGKVIERFVGEVGEGNGGTVHNVVKVVRKLGSGDTGLVCEGCDGIIGDGGGSQYEREGENGLCGGCAGAVRRGGEKVERVLGRGWVKERRKLGEEEMRERIAEFLL